MKDLQTFIKNQQQDEVVRERQQPVADRYRVPIPPLRLNRASSMTRNNASGGNPLELAPAILQQELVNKQETCGFDTDAESLDDTTIMTNTAEIHGPPQAVQTKALDSRIFCESDLGPGNVQADTRFQLDEEARIEDKSSSLFFDKVSSESESCTSHSGQPSFASVGNNYRSKEFIKFKRRNLHDKSFLRALGSSQDYATALCVATSFYPPGHANQTSIPSSLPSPKPIPEFIGRRSNPQSESAKDGYQETRSFPTQCGLVKNEAAPLQRSVQDQIAVVATSHRLDSAAFNLQSMKLLTKKNDSPGPIKLCDMPKRPASRGPPAHAIDCGSDGGSGPVSELSDEDDLGIKVENGVRQNILKRRCSLDYSLDELRSMTFQELRKDPFEKNPVPITSLPMPKFTEPPLAATLEQLFFDEDSRDHQIEHQFFFDELSIRQYAECGELIGEKLSEAITHLSRIRQEKRKVMSRFEEEIAEQETTITNKAAALKRKKGVMTQRIEELATVKTAQTAL